MSVTVKRTEGPGAKKLNALIGNRASIRILHICRRTMPRLEPLKQSGIQALSLNTVDIGTAMLVADRKYAIFGNISPDKVLCSKSSEEIYEIEMNDGTIIKCTGNHPVLTLRGWVNAENLSHDDRIINILS